MKLHGRFILAGAFNQLKQVQTIPRCTGTDSVLFPYPYQGTGTGIVRGTGKIWNWRYGVRTGTELFWKMGTGTGTGIENFQKHGTVTGTGTGRSKKWGYGYGVSDGISTGNGKYIRKIRIYFRIQRSLKSQYLMTVQISLVAKQKSFYCKEVVLFDYWVITTKVELYC